MFVKRSKRYMPIFEYLQQKRFDSILLSGGNVEKRIYECIIDEKSP
jgi:hypothetical protein